MKAAKKTLKRIITLIWLLAGIVVAVGVVLFFTMKISLIPYICGELLGSVISTVLMLHRYMTLDIELDMEEKNAKNHLKTMATIRVVVMLGALFLGFYLPNIFWPFTVFTGLFATKLAALLYPLFYKE